MGLRDDALQALAMGQQVLSDLEMHRVTVVVRVETWSAAVGTAGATKSTSDTTLSPNPPVVKVGDEESFYAGDGPQASTGAPRLAVYRIGPIPGRSSTSTGYDLSHLLPQTSTTRRRSVLLLSGGEVGSTPVAFEVVPDGVRVDALGTTLTVRQAQAL